LAKEFTRQGHEVTVLFPTNGRDYAEYERINNVKIKDLGALGFKTIKLDGSGPLLLFKRALRRTLQILFEYPDIELMFKVAKTLKYENGYDLLISIAVPHPIHWGVSKVWKKGNSIAKKWIADCGDPYMGCSTDSFKKLFYFKYIEKWFMRKADFVSIPVESARAAYYNEFQGKIRIIPQGFHLVVKGKNDRVNNSIPTFAYAGGFIPGIRDPRLFLEYLAKVEKDFCFILYTNSFELLNGYYKKLGSKLVVREYIPREELLAVLSTMDFLVNFDNNTQSAMPSKLIDYLIARRPVLNIKRELDEIAINEFLDGNYSKKMDPEDIEKYNIKNVVSQFIELMN
jgi:hypothetical protein